MQERETATPVAEPLAPTASPASAPLIGAFSPERVLALQRTAGNTAVTRFLSTHDLIAGVQAERAAQRPLGSKRFRVPKTADVQKMLADKTLTLEQVKASIRTGLERLRAENRIDVKQTVDQQMALIFPKAGGFDASAYERLTGAGTNAIYKDAAQGLTKVKDADKPGLLAAIAEASKLATQAQSRDADLAQVFGAANVAKAKAIYVKAVAAMAKVKGNLDGTVDTDYNGDDDEVGLGGFAVHDEQRIHLDLTTVQVTDPDESALTIVHECAHLADASVDDNGYYGSDGFESMDEALKLANAAHFEEVPRRIKGISQYAGQTFTPGKTSSGGALTLEDKVSRDVSEYLRNAWDKAVDVHTFIRAVLVAGNGKAFTDAKAALLEISALMQLTIHQQPPASQKVTPMDVTLAEGVAHAMSQLSQKPITLSPEKVKTGSEDVRRARWVKDTIDQEIRANPLKLTGGPAGDRKLLDWLVGHYRQAI